MAPGFEVSLAQPSLQLVERKVQESLRSMDHDIKWKYVRGAREVGQICENNTLKQDT